MKFIIWFIVFNLFEVVRHLILIKRKGGYEGYQDWFDSLHPIIAIIATLAHWVIFFVLYYNFIA